jgi:hypothetical protein
MVACVLIVWENFGIKLFGLLRQENFFSADIMSRDYCSSCDFFDNYTLAEKPTRTVFML